MSFIDRKARLSLGSVVELITHKSRFMITEAKVPELFKLDESLLDEMKERQIGTVHFEIGVVVSSARGARNRHLKYRQPARTHVDYLDNTFPCRDLGKSPARISIKCP